MAAPEGNSWGGAPPGNQNAVGNPGGGAPALNSNAQKHGAFSYDHDRLYDRLARDEPDVRAFVDTLEARIEVRADDLPNLEQRARAVALQIVLHDRAVRDVQDRGVVLENGSRNPCVSRARRLAGQIRDELDELGVYAI